MVDEQSYHLRNSEVTLLQTEQQNLKCIWNEIFDLIFIVPYESARKMMTITVYCSSISILDPELQGLNGWNLWRHKYDLNGKPSCFTYFFVAVK